MRVYYPVYILLHIMPPQIVRHFCIQFCILLHLWPYCDTNCMQVLDTILYIVAYDPIVTQIVCNFCIQFCILWHMILLPHKWYAIFTYNFKYCCIWSYCHTPCIILQMVIIIMIKKYTWRDVTCTHQRSWHVSSLLTQQAKPGNGPGVPGFHYKGH